MHCLLLRNGVEIGADLQVSPCDCQDPMCVTVESCTDDQGNEVEPTDAEVEAAIKWEMEGVNW